MKTIIIGAGASGLMLAAHLRDNTHTLILEGNDSPGAKIAVSGGGRCNLTNAIVAPEYYYPLVDFVQPALRGFGSHDTVAWFASRGVHPVRQKRDQYFAPHSAREVLDVLMQASREATIQTHTRVERVNRQNGMYEVVTDRGTYLTARLVVASGGVSYPRLGASDIGYRIAEKFGHQIVPPRPALVGMTLQREQFFFKELSGLSTEVIITLEGRQIRDRLLFAHKGISGPAVLDASLYWHKGQIEIDFLPDLDLSGLRQSSKQISTILPLPKRLARALLAHLGMEDMPGNRMRSHIWKKLEKLHRYCFAPAGTFGYSKAEVTRGGVSTDMIHPKTMESRREPSLYFIGEVLDVTGRLGGYNFQWAFSSAVACAGAINRPES
jgi:predicted Rossmann fold flavoprotein